ncbi:MAG: hypothetical protein MJ092_03910 [Lachnospiraceae bacterium]|nr:hypothetical protein [Lachnospiraceae bacterium]
MKKMKQKVMGLFLCLIMMLSVLSTMTFAAEDELPELSGVRLTGDILSWDAFEGADHYSISGGTGNWTVWDTSCSLAELFESRGYTSNNYAVTIHAQDASYQQISGEDSFIYTYTSKNPQLETPTGFTWNGNIISWNPVANATGYDVFLCKDSFYSVPIMIPSSGTNADITNYLVEGTEEYGVFVQATAPGYPSSGYGYSELTTISKSFPELRNVVLSGDILSWDAFSGAEDYSISGGNGNWSTTDTSCNLAKMFESYGYSSGTYEVSIYARDISARQISSSVKYTYTYTGEKEQLDTPSGLVWNDREISWNPVANAESYQVQLFEDSYYSIPSIFEVTETKANISSYLREGTRQYGVKVYAKAPGYPNSEAAQSEMTTITYGMPSLTNVKINDDILSWDAFAGVLDYAVEIRDADTINIYTSETSLDLADLLKEFEKGKGKYSISLYARKIGGERISKIWIKDDYLYAPTHEIIAFSAYEERGSVTGGGTYQEGDTVTIQAIPFEGYEFIYWTDQWGCIISGADEEYSFLLKSDSSASYTAWFKEAGEWKLNSTGWWYGFKDGTYYADGIYKINDVNYAFNEKGYMVTGWYAKDGDWFYFDEHGAMCYGWVKPETKWYYMDPSTGKMAAGWLSVDGQTYYLAPSGAMQTGWQFIDGKWYYFFSSGDGAKDWQKINGIWYYFESGMNHPMVTGRKVINGKIYFFNPSGAMQTGWQIDGGVWSYYDPSGAAVTAAWVGDYYLDSQGIMVTYAYIQRGEKYYWVNRDGKYTKTYQESDTPGYTVYDEATGNVIG